MNAHRKGIQLSAEEQVEIFGTTVISEEDATEAEERWGDTERLEAVSAAGRGLHQGRRAADQGRG